MDEVRVEPKQAAGFFRGERVTAWVTPRPADRGQVSIPIFETTGYVTLDAIHVRDAGGEQAEETLPLSRHVVVQDEDVVTLC